VAALTPATTILSAVRLVTWAGGLVKTSNPAAFTVVSVAREAAGNTTVEAVTVAPAVVGTDVSAGPVPRRLPSATVNV